MRRSVAALCLTLLFAACLSLPKTVTTDTNWKDFVKVGPVIEFAEAITECQDGRPVVVVRSMDVPALEMEAIWAHERVHVEQMSRTTMPCELYERYMTSNPYVLLRHEAEAYCGQAKWMIRRTPQYDPLMMLLDAAAGQANYYRSFNHPAWAVTPAQAASLFISLCPEAVAYVHYRNTQRRIAP